MELKRDELIEINNKLIGDIEKCAMAIINVQMAGNAVDDAKTLFRNMGKLLIDCQQQLTCNNDFLTRDLDIDSIELAGYKRGVEAACERIQKMQYRLASGACIDMAPYAEQIKKDLLR